MSFRHEEINIMRDSQSHSFPNTVATACPLRSLADSSSDPQSAHEEDDDLGGKPDHPDFRLFALFEVILRCAKHDIGGHRTTFTSREPFRPYLGHSVWLTSARRPARTGATSGGMVTSALCSRYAAVNATRERETGWSRRITETPPPPRPDRGVLFGDFMVDRNAAAQQVRACRVTTSMMSARGGPISPPFLHDQPRRRSPQRLIKCRTRSKTDTPHLGSELQAVAG